MADPSFEPTDEDFGELMHKAMPSARNTMPPSGHCANEFVSNGSACAASDKRVGVR